MKNPKLKLSILIILILLIPYPAWYIANVYAANLLNHEDLIEFGMTDEFKYCLDWNPELKSVTDEYGWTTMHFAASFNRVDILRYLLENGAEINVKDDQGYTPLLLAIETESLDAFKLLLDNGADPNSKQIDGYNSPVSYTHLTLPTNREV